MQNQEDNSEVDLLSHSSNASNVSKASVIVLSSSDTSTCSSEPGHFVSGATAAANTGNITITNCNDITMNVLEGNNVNVSINNNATITNDFMDVAAPETTTTQRKTKRRRTYGTPASIPSKYSFQPTIEASTEPPSQLLVFQEDGEFEGVEESVESSSHHTSAAPIATTNNNTTTTTSSDTNNGKIWTTRSKYTELENSEEEEDYQMEDEEKDLPAILKEIEKAEQLEAVKLSRELDLKERNVAAAAAAAGGTDDSTNDTMNELNHVQELDIDGYQESMMKEPTSTINTAVAPPTPTPTRKRRSPVDRANSIICLEDENQDHVHDVDNPIENQKMHIPNIHDEINDEQVDDHPDKKDDDDDDERDGRLQKQLAQVNNIHVVGGSGIIPGELPDDEDMEPVNHNAVHHQQQQHHHVVEEDEDDDMDLIQKEEEKQLQRAIRISKEESDKNELKASKQSVDRTDSVICLDNDNNQRQPLSEKVVRQGTNHTDSNDNKMDEINDEDNDAVMEEQHTATQSNIQIAPTASTEATTNVEDHPTNKTTIPPSQPTIDVRQWVEEPLTNISLPKYQDEFRSKIMKPLQKIYSSFTTNTSSIAAPGPYSAIVNGSSNKKNGNNGSGDSGSTEEINELDPPYEQVLYQIRQRLYPIFHALVQDTLQELNAMEEEESPSTSKATSSFHQPSTRPLNQRLELPGLSYLGGEETFTFVDSEARNLTKDKLLSQLVNSLLRLGWKTTTTAATTASSIATTTTSGRTTRSSTRIANNTGTCTTTPPNTILQGVKTFPSTVQTKMNQFLKSALNVTTSNKKTNVVCTPPTPEVTILDDDDDNSVKKRSGGNGGGVNSSWDTKAQSLDSNIPNLIPADVPITPLLPPTNSLVPMNHFQHDQPPPQQQPQQQLLQQQQVNYRWNATCEDLVACILLDIVGTITTILNIAVGSYGDKCNVSQESSAEDVDDAMEVDECNEKNNNHDDDQECEEISLLRQEAGLDLVSILPSIFATKACSGGYKECLRRWKLVMQQEQQHSSSGNGSSGSIVPEKSAEVILSSLSPFYKSHLFMEGPPPPSSTVEEEENDPGKEANKIVSLTSPLRDSTKNIYKDVYSLPDEKRHGPENGQWSPGFGFSYHIIALVRYFVSLNGIQSLNRLISLPIKAEEDDDKEDTIIDVDYVEEYLDVMRSVSFISTYAVHPRQYNDCLSSSCIGRHLDKSREVLINYFQSIRMGENIKSTEDRKGLMMLLNLIQERSWNDQEKAMLVSSGRGGGGNEDKSVGVSCSVDLTCSESRLLKLSILWQCLTGSIPGSMSDDVVAPPLQCQIQGLTEFISWLVSLEKDPSQSAEFKNVLFALSAGDHHLLRHLLSPNGLHLELLKRSAPLIYFFARHKRLSNDDVSLLWEATGLGTLSEKHTLDDGGAEEKINLHESVTSTALSIIYDLVSADHSWSILGRDLLSHFVQLFSQARCSTNWTIQSLNILQSSVQCALDLMMSDHLEADTSSNIDIVYNVMDIFWSLILDNSKLPKQLSDLAFQQLTNIFKYIFSNNLTRAKLILSAAISIRNQQDTSKGQNDEAALQRALSKVLSTMKGIQSKIIERLMDSVKNAVDSVNQTSSIRLLSFALNVLPLRSNVFAIPEEEKDTPCMLSFEGIISSSDLSSICTDSIVYYSRHAQKEMSVGDQIDENDDERVIPGSYYRHSECMAFRLHLFKLVIKRFQQLEQTNTEIAKTAPSPEQNSTCSKKRKWNESGTICDVETTSEREYRSNPRIRNAEVMKLLPTPQHIDTIWYNCISNFTTNAAMDQVLSMFLYLISFDCDESTPCIKRWKQEMTEKFYPLACSLQPSSIGEVGYKLLIFCLGYINVLDRNFEVSQCSTATASEKRVIQMSNVLMGLQHGSSTESSSILCSLLENRQNAVTKIVSHDITGLSHLWAIILDGKDEKVVEMCVGYMAVLQTFSNSITNEKRSIDGLDNNADLHQQVIFVRKCMDELKDQEDQCQLRQKRTLHLLRVFVNFAMENSEPHGCVAGILGDLQMEGNISTSLPFYVYVQLLNGPLIRIFCSLGESTTISFVKKYIQYYFKKARKQQEQGLHLEFDGNELVSDSALLKDCKIKENSILRQRANSSVRISLSPEEETDTSTTPRHFNSHLSYEEYDLVVPGIKELVSDKCIETLFTTLSSTACKDLGERRQIRFLIWDLLQILPTQLCLLSAVERIDQQEEGSLTWESWFPFPGKDNQLINEFRLLYSVQVIEKILFGPNSKMGKRSQCFDNDLSCHSNGNIKNTVFPTESPGLSPVRTSKNGNEPKTNEHISIENSHCNKKCATYSDLMHNSKRWCQKFVSLGGLTHLMRLLETMDLPKMLSNIDFESCSVNKNGDEGRDRFCLLISCANKILFLVRMISTIVLHGNVNGGHECDLRSIIECDDFTVYNIVQRLLRFVHWAVTFQIVNFTVPESELLILSNGPTERSDLSPTSKFCISADLGGSLVLQCFCLIKFLICDMISNANIIPIYDHFLFDSDDGNRSSNNISLVTIERAIELAMVASPSMTVRSQAQIFFRSIILREDRNQFESTRSDAGIISSSASYQALPVFISLVSCIGERKPTTVASTDFAASCARVFEMTIDYLREAWSDLNEEGRHRSKICFMHNLQEFQENQSNVASKPPYINRIENIGCLGPWLLREIISFQFGNQSPSKNISYLHSYGNGLLSLLGHLFRFTGNAASKGLIGKIKISETLLLEVIFDKFAFNSLIEKSAGAGCTLFNQTTQKLCFNLLETLCIDCIPNLRSLLITVNERFYSGLPRNDLLHQWSNDPMNQRESTRGHVGMTNQGATCYVNSLLQQFFHTPALCQGILSCDLNSNAINQPDTDREFLSEIQNLFGNLIFSEKRDVDTADLVKSIRGYDGNPIRPGEQQDVDEFFNLFCDRLETALQNFPEHRLLHNCFGGQVVHTIKCQECKYTSNRVEDFLSISLDVKGKQNIVESLDLYTQGEVLGGQNKYFCCKCNDKKDSIKSCRIQTLPNTLFCHLKRFEFDLEKLRKVKVNDRCEFPLVLDMKPYMSEGTDSYSWRTDKYYQYTLRGVLVHTGTADSGHYYSFAQVRHSTTSSLDEKGCWYCFNDSTVTPFDLSTLDTSAFGGPAIQEKSNAKAHSMKPYSAYLLIYDREVWFDFDQQTKVDLSKSSNPILMKNHIQYEQSHYEQNSWNMQVVNDNDQHKRDKILFSSEYEGFLTQMRKMYISFKTENKTDSSLLLKMIQVTTFHLLDNLIHLKDRLPMIGDIFTLLKTWYKSSEEGCIWFLQTASTTHQIWVEKILLNCSSPDIRRHFVKLLHSIFQCRAPIERDTYYDEIMNEYDKEKTVQDYDISDEDDDLVAYNHTNRSVAHRSGRLKFWRSKSVLARFVGICLLERIESCESSWRRFGHLFEAIHAFASVGHDEALFLIRCGSILRLIDVYLGENSAVPHRSFVKLPRQSSEPSDTKTRAKMGNVYTKPNFTPLLSLLQLLVCSVMIIRKDLSGDISDSDSDQDNETSEMCTASSLTLDGLKRCEESGLIFALPQREKRLISRDQFLEHVMQERLESAKETSLTPIQSSGTDSVSKMISHICFGDKETTSKVFSLGTQLTNRKNGQFNFVAKVLISMLKIKDEHTQERTQRIFTIFSACVKKTGNEKNSSLLYEALKDELRRSGRKRREDDFDLHALIFGHLDKLISGAINGNASHMMKQGAISFLRSFLPIGGDDDRTKAPEVDSGHNNKLRKASNPTHTLEANTRNEESVASEIHNEELCRGNFLPFMDEDAIKDDIFNMLKPIFDNICFIVASQSSDIINNKGNQSDWVLSNDFNAPLLDSTLYAEYFEALRLCLTGPQSSNRIGGNISWISGASEVLLGALLQIDEEGRSKARPTADVVKGEMIRFYKCLVDLNANLAFTPVGRSSSSASSSRRRNPPRKAKSTEKEITITSLVEIYVMNIEECASYNNTYITHYYNLLIACAKYDYDFRRQVLDHNNWKWALKSFVLNTSTELPKVPGCYDVILNGTLEFVCVDRNFRESIFTLIMRPDNDLPFLERNSLDTSSLQLIKAIFMSDGNNGKCNTKFFNSQIRGMSQLSLAFKRFNAAFDDDNSISSIKDTSLCGLNISLECFSIILNSFDIAKRRHIIENSWPEVDDINSTCLQIITRTDSDWERCCGNVELDTVAISQVVSAAQDVQRMMASVHASDFPSQ